MVDERQIVEQVLKGNLKAFELLTQKYERLVFHIANGFVNDPLDAQDISQEAFFKIYKNLSTFNFESKLSTWIGKIVYNTSINYIKKHDKAQYNEPMNELSERRGDYGAFIDPESILQKKQSHHLLHNAIEELPLHYRSVIVLYHLREFSYEEIGSILNITESKIKSDLFRARKILEKKLSKYL